MNSNCYRISKFSWGICSLNVYRGSFVMTPRAIYSNHLQQFSTYLFMRAATLVLTSTHVETERERDSRMHGIIKEDASITSVYKGLFYGCFESTISFSHRYIERRSPRIYLAKQSFDSWIRPHRSDILRALRTFNWVSWIMS